MSTGTTEQVSMMILKREGDICINQKNWVPDFDYGLHYWTKSFVDVRNTCSSAVPLSSSASKTVRWMQASQYIVAASDLNEHA
jgi:hypothetical protein